jgi:hypothetical protein
MIKSYIIMPLAAFYLFCLSAGELIGRDEDFHTALLQLDHTWSHAAVFVLNDIKDAVHGVIEVIIAIYDEVVELLDLLQLLPGDLEAAANLLLAVRRSLVQSLEELFLGGRV